MFQSPRRPSQVLPKGCLIEEEELCYSPYVHRYGNSRRGFADDYVRELAVRLGRFWAFLEKSSFVEK